MALGDLIKEYRKKAGFTQKEFAQKTGLAEITIRQYENNKRQPRLENIEKRADVLGVDSWDFYNEYALNSNPDKSAWPSFLSDKLEQIGCNIFYVENNDVSGIEFPDGYLELSDQELWELDNKTISYLRTQLEELRNKHLKDFRSTPYREEPEPHKLPDDSDTPK